MAAEARFLRAFYNYHVLDNWGLFPHREPGSSLLIPPVTLKGAEATDWLISELEAIIPDLPQGSPASAGKASKNSARMLLAKLYLNRGAFADRQSPTFAEADMDKVIAHVDDIIASGAYSLSDLTLTSQTFRPITQLLLLENIFVTVSNAGIRTGLR